MNKKSNGVILDTSFLTKLVDSTCKEHQAAKAHWAHFVSQDIRVFLPTIVVSEFQVVEPIPDFIYSSATLLPFNFNDAETCAKINFPKVEHRPGAKGQPGARQAIKDDIKIIAQAINENVSYAISGDTETFLKFVKRLHTEGITTCRGIALTDNFDPSIYNNDGQTELPLTAVSNHSSDQSKR